MVLVAPGTASNKKLLVTKGIATSSKAGGHQSPPLHPDQTHTVVTSRGIDSGGATRSVRRREMRKEE